jgi:concentrative nucleoside transporter, CNT family
MERWISLLGLGVMVLLAWLMSENRRRLNVRLIVSGIVLQFGLAFLLLWTAPGQRCSRRLAWRSPRCWISRTRAPRSFSAAISWISVWRSCGVFRAADDHLRLVADRAAVPCRDPAAAGQVDGSVMVWVMDVSGAESLCAAANVFVGMTEAPLVIRPYLVTMTRSELMAMMTAGMATIAGA